VAPAAADPVRSISHDPRGLARQVDRLLRLSSMVTLPLCAGLAGDAGATHAAAVGAGVDAGGRGGGASVGLMALAALMFPSGVALIAVGRARFTLYANLAGLAATVALVLLARPATPWAAVLVWCGAQVFVSPYSLWVNGRALGVGALWPLRAGVVMLAASGARRRGGNDGRGGGGAGDAGDALRPWWLALRGWVRC